MPADCSVCLYVSCGSHYEGEEPEVEERIVQGEIAQVVRVLVEYMLVHDNHLSVSPLTYMTPSKK